MNSSIYEIKDSLYSNTYFNVELCYYVVNTNSTHNNLKELQIMPIILYYNIIFIIRKIIYNLIDINFYNSIIINYIFLIYSLLK